LWNDWQWKLKYSEKTCPSAALDVNPGCRGGKPATNRLSYGMAKWTVLHNGGLPGVYIVSLMREQMAASYSSQREKEHEEFFVITF
jgi:hypothetical protein